MHKYKKIFIIFFIISYFNFLELSYAQSYFVNNISQYLKKINEFGCDFIQSNPDGSVSEGNMIYSNNKIRLQYTVPTKIIFIAREKKAMYFNQDLEEVEYFNPNKTILGIFKSIYKLNEMSKESYEIKIKNGVIELVIKDLLVEELNSFSIIFQNNPVVLKKIQWEALDGKSTFAFYNINRNVTIDKKTFNLANPLL